MTFSIETDRLGVKSFDDRSRIGARHCGSDLRVDYLAYEPALRRRARTGPDLVHIDVQEQR